MLSLALAACSGGGTTPGAESGSAKPPAPAGSGAAINDPKDVASSNLCSLLPSSAANALGVNPVGKNSFDSINGTPTCDWTSDNGRHISLAPMPTGIDGLYAQAGSHPDFQKLTIAGHPAARANDADPKTLSSCFLYVGTKPNQMLFAGAWIDKNHDANVDQCQLAQQALEAAVPALPPAK